jgi:hypothetical protein
VAREPINLGRIDRWQKIASVSQHRAVVALTPVRVADVRRGDEAECEDDEKGD